jgi:hypothetical protein
MDIINTKDLSCDKLYKLLVDTYDGNNIHVFNWFKQHGFICKCVIKLNKIDQDYLNMEKYNNMLYENKIVTTKYTFDEFKNNKNNVMEKYERLVVIIKYNENLRGPQFWKNKWAKELRGVVLFINPDTNNVSILVYKIPRGAEVVTNMHKKNGITDTQDIKENKVNILDDEQIDTCTRLICGDKIQLHLTSKVDGSMLVITSYTGYKKYIMLALISTFSTNYIKLWAEQSMQLTNGVRLLVPSTSGTLWDS